jgi:hypothetical protein
MKFKNHKNKLERPFALYADVECSLMKTGHNEKMHKHKPNTCSFLFECTFDNSRNEYFKFQGKDCIVEMINKMREIADKCILEMKDDTGMIYTEEDAIDFKKCYMLQYL